MGRIEELRQATIARLKDESKGENWDICIACIRKVYLLGDSVIQGQNRKYEDGSGDLPDECNNHVDCLARQLLE